MSLRVDEEILRDWRERLAAGFDPGTTMRLSPTTPVGEALAALDAVVDEVVEGPRRGDGPPSPGEWSWIRAVDDVIVTVRECDVLAALLPAVVAGLEARGVGGALHAHVPPIADAELPAPVGMLEARLRARGRREHLGGRTYAWRADPEAFASALDVALGWCTGGGGSRAWLTVSGDGPVELPVDGLGARVPAETPMGTLQVRVGARGLGVDAFAGRVALIETDARRERSLAALRDVLRGAAGSLAYALVKTGSHPSLAVIGQSLVTDWPPRPELGGDLPTAARAFEDRYAPDAFGLQLLGPGYEGRVPPTPLYRAEPAGAGCTLLEHADLPAWLDEPFGPAVPPVLAEAREALAPILFGPELL